MGPMGLAGYDYCLFNKSLTSRLAELLPLQDAWIRRVQAARIRASVSAPVRRQAAVSNFRTMLSRLGHSMRLDQQPINTVAPPNPTLQED